MGSEREAATTLPPRALDEERWKAVLARDGSKDGSFVFGVRSTGIFCKPSCPARHPDIEQVIFFAGPDDAESSGFRACRRANQMIPEHCREQRWSNGSANTSDRISERSLH